MWGIFFSFHSFYFSASYNSALLSHETIAPLDVEGCSTAQKLWHWHSTSDWHSTKPEYCIVHMDTQVTGELARTRRARARSQDFPHNCTLYLDVMQTGHFGSRRTAEQIESAHTACNRNPETRQKLCGAVRWYRAAVVWRLWRRRPQTRVRSSIATHLLTSLNLPVSSLAPDSNWIPVTLVACAEDGLEARAGCRALGRRIV